VVGGDILLEVGVGIRLVVAGLVARELEHIEWKPEGNEDLSVEAHKQVQPFESSSTRPTNIATTGIRKSEMNRW